jgi:MFS family permease
MKHQPHHHAVHHKLYTICLIGFLFGLNTVLPAYFNSSFLKTLIGEEAVSAAFIAAAVATIIGLLSVHHLLRHLGNYGVILWASVCQILVTYALAWVVDPFLGVFFFVASAALASIVSLNLDIFLEADSDTHHTGSIRGLYLSITNIAWIVGPMLGGALITEHAITSARDFAPVFITAAALLIPFIILVHRHFCHFTDTQYSSLSEIATIKKLIKTHSLRRLFIGNIVLQMFYAWMVVYAPLYLHGHLGFSWEDLGIMFTIMLIPFVIIDYPLGKLADRYGEKRLMTAGFALLGVTTALLCTLATSPFNGSLWLWTTLLFMTRVGAATIEIMVETYFFKKVPERDASVLGIFRITRPVAYVIMPIVAAILTPFVSPETMFLIIGCTMLIGVYASGGLRDIA